jgi:hypothetical protein
MKNEQEFNLSDRIWKNNGEFALVNPSSIIVKDVKEFITRLKEDFCKETLLFDDEGMRWFLIRINKLAGADLRPKTNMEGK